MLRILGLGFIALIGSAGCATVDYVGENLAPTTHVDIFFSMDDIHRDHKVMGQTKAEGSDLMTFQAIQDQLVKDAMKHGADGLVIEGMDKVVVGETSHTHGKDNSGPEYTVDADGNLQIHEKAGKFDSNTFTTEIRDKVISGKLIKYTD